MKDLNEIKIIKGCSSGNPKYQKMLYEKYYGKMLNICQRYTRGQEEAKDILQEGFVKVFKNIQNFKGDGSLEGWIRRIMVNTAINHFHKFKKYEANDPIHDCYQELPGSSYDHEFALQNLGYQEILKLIRELPSSCQTVFNLHVIEGYNHREIADLLNISEGTSKSYLARAREKLQKSLGMLKGELKMAWA
ncbi:MAG: sigma-70 family RNA polymerase sigma factor [Microscillaceae bacterium]|nr:sigma-70 family RNA polymerase sigma factor [Microscillaceae bacterium]